MIVGFDSHFMGYRHAGYYLPEYLTVQYPEIPFRSGTRAFVMHHTNTGGVSKLPLGAQKAFVFFPLPTGEKAYLEHFNRTRERIPAARLRTVSVAGREFVTGSVCALPFLFPTVLPVLAQERCVSTELQSGRTAVNSR
jgi:hypothetical protein